MYLQTLSISDFDTENAEADCCQQNCVFESLLSFINRSVLSATIVAKVSSSDNFGVRERGSEHARDWHK
jgi:hypothetical protein